MGKIKGFLIQALDNNEDPVYNLLKLKQEIQRDEGKKKAKSDSKRFVEQSDLQTQKSTGQAKA